MDQIKNRLKGIFTSPQFFPVAVMFVLMMAFVVYESKIQAAYKNEIAFLELKNEALLEANKELVLNNQVLNKKIEKLDRSFFAKIGDFFSSEEDDES